MQGPLPAILDVVVISQVEDSIVERIKAVAPGRINVHVARTDFLPEMEKEWPERTLAILRDALPAKRTREEVEALVAGMHVALFRHPFPKTLPKRAKNLLWAHFALAGVSGIRDTDWWRAPFPVTSARGFAATRPCAESALGGAFMLARRLDFAALSTRAGNFEPSTYDAMSSIGGKTMGIVGLGGIGAELAKLARGCGMRVIATRHSAAARARDVDGVDELFPASELHELLAQSDFIVVCVMLTDQTHKMMNEAAFRAIKRGAFFINIARGKVVDEPPLIRALNSRHLAGAYLDVWDDDFSGPPSVELRAAKNIVISPRISNRSDARGRGSDLFCDNLARLLRGEPLENTIDWERGY